MQGAIKINSLHFKRLESKFLAYTMTSFHSLGEKQAITYTLFLKSISSFLQITDNKEK